MQKASHQASSALHALGKASTIVNAGMRGHLQASQAQQQETADTPVQIPLGHVHLCDINPGMLQEGFKKAKEKGLGDSATTVLLSGAPPQPACLEACCATELVKLLWWTGTAQDTALQSQMLHCCRQVWSLALGDRGC